MYFLLIRFQKQIPSDDRLPPPTLPPSKKGRSWKKEFSTKRLNFKLWLLTAGENLTHDMLSDISQIAIRQYGRPEMSIWFLLWNNALCAHYVHCTRKELWVNWSWGFSTIGYGHASSHGNWNRWCVWRQIEDWEESKYETGFNFSEVVRKVRWCGSLCNVSHHKELFIKKISRHKIGVDPPPP